MAKLWPCLLALLLAAPCHAAEIRFRASMGGADLGWLAYETKPGTARLTSEMRGTPFGAMDGQFTAQSQPGPGGTVYQSTGSSARKTRLIGHVVDKAGKVLSVSVSPATEKTALSAPDAVAFAVVDPVKGLGHLLAGTSCPAPVTLYDGRRVVQISLRDKGQAGAVLTCHMDYRVIAGPGHVSPFRFTALDLTLIYNPARAAAGPSDISLRAGLFEVQFSR